jgi:hypothetical protein
MKYLIILSMLFSGLAFAGKGDLKGGSQYETKLRQAGIPVLGFSSGRA